MKKIVIISLISIILFSTNIYAYNYSINNDNIESIESENDCWVGWKEYHYGNVDELAKKGQSFYVPGSPIIKKHEDGTTEYHEGQSYEITTNGYGYYSLDFEKHVLALLSYIKKNINIVGNYDTNYKPTENSTLVDYALNEKGNVKLEDALRIAMNGMISNWYSESYENDEFEIFWKGTFIESEKDNLKIIQNKFYWDAYGESAYNKLISMMSGYKLNSIQKQVLKGVVFSIMEARYRNKNVQGKMNLKIKAAEGELWPFLVYLENLSDISYDSNLNKYVNSDGTDAIYQFPDFDKLIEGAYQWMIYHDADTIRTTSHRTITKTISEINGKEEEDVEIDWESEFCDLTWDYLPALNKKELEEFYSNCQLVKSIFKKSSENTMGFFGAEELYDITSDKNFSEAIRDMKTAMLAFCGGDTMDSVWTGLKDYNMERTYIMAKNIVETNRVKDEFAYYNIGTNIITYTYGRHGKEYMLMDLQRIKLEEALKDKEDKWIEYDTDGDGIFDKDELGDDESDTNDESTMWKKVDITKFIKKAVEKELYGNDTKEINSDEGKLMVNTALAQVKYNVYKERKQFIDKHPDDNECDRKEDKENYLNIDSVTENIINGKTDVEIKEEMKKDSAKLQVRLWKYKSNPVLKDTDFDGLDDKIDKSPKNNHFVGRMNSTRMSGIDDGLEMDMTMDYRYFFLSNKLYYDELSTMSLLYANSVYMQNSGISVYSDNNPSLSDLRIKELMEFYGFKDVRTYYMGTEKDDGYEKGDICRNYHRKDTHKGRVALGYKNIEYHGLEKTIIGVVIRGTAEDDDWDSDFDMGDKTLRNALFEKTIVSSGKENNTIEKNVVDGSTKNSRVIDMYFKHNGTYGDDNKPLEYSKKYFDELKHFAYGYPDWKWEYHHAGFDIVSNRILEVLNEYKNSINGDIKEELCYWVTGHSMGGGVANLVAASLVSSESISEIRELEADSDNVYCYTYAAPNTFYLTDNTYDRESYVIPGQNVTGDYREPHGVKYRCIFNIVNEDDFVPEVPMKKCNWTKYGRTATISFNSNKYEIEKIIKNEDKFKYVSYDRSVTKDYIHNQYKGNTETIKDIVDSFNKIFQDDPENMRYSAYTFDENDYIVSRDFLTNPNLPKNTMPYQKINRNTIPLPSQYQMPAYFMQYIAYCMHGGFPLIVADSSDAGFFFAQFTKKYINSKDTIIDRKDLIVLPHYLETYYLLTKTISPVNFE